MKKLSIFLISLFSIFLFIFIPGVKAATSDIIISGENIPGYGEGNFLGDFTTNHLEEIKNNNSDYDFENEFKYFIIILRTHDRKINGKQVNANSITIQFFNKPYTLIDNGDSYSFRVSGAFKRLQYDYGGYNDTFIVDFNTMNLTKSLVLSEISWMAEDTYYKEIINGKNYLAYDSINSSNYIKPSSYDVTFHLNGGIATDSYQSNLEKNVFIDEMTNIINSNGLLDEYPSIKNEWLKIFNEPNMEKLQNFFEKFLTDVNTQSELIPIYKKLIDKEYSQPVNYYEDFTTTIKKDELRDYLYNQEVKKEGMTFKGWYYDKNFTQKVNSDDALTENKDFYAKFVYDNVDDFLNNTTFNTYTFDTNYEYVVISLNDKTNRDIYLGFDFMSYNLEVYKYDKYNNITLEGAKFCLTPYFSKDDKYYYYLNSPLDEDYEVLIIPKKIFQENYTFLVSTNAYVTYTNDLKKLIIKDDDGNDLSIDIEDSYNYSQDALLNDGNDILEIFKKLMENKDNNVFAYVNQIWNYLKRSKLYTYLLTLIIGSLVILIIKVARR